MSFLNAKKKVRIFMLSKKKEKVDCFCSMLMGFVRSPYRPVFPTMRQFPLLTEHESVMLV